MRTQPFSWAAVVNLACAAILLCLVQPSSAVRYAFSDESPDVCFVVEVRGQPADKKGTVDNYVLGFYTWYPHPKNQASSLTLQFKSPDEQELGKAEMVVTNNKKDPVPFVFKAPPGDVGGYYVCATLTSRAGVLADLPIEVDFQLEPEGDWTAFGTLLDDMEEVEQALRRQYGLKRRRAGGGHGQTEEATREVVEDGKVAFTFLDHGGQPKSILQPKEYMEQLTRELNRLMILTKQRLDILKNDLGKEEEMRSTSESTFSRVWVCSVVVIMFTALVVSWQFSLLKKTLKRKKMI